MMSQLGCCLSLRALQMLLVCLLLLSEGQPKELAKALLSHLLENFSALKLPVSPATKAVLQQPFNLFSMMQSACAVFAGKL